MKAILNKIIVKEPEVKENVTASGIHLQNKTDRKEAKAFEVISIGGNVWSVSVGNSILASDFAGEKFSVDGVDYRLLSEEEVIAIL